MKTKFSLLLLCSMVVFSCNTRAAQEGDSEREITIYNNLKVVVTIYYASANEEGVGRDILTSFTDESILFPGKEKSYSTRGSCFYYAPLKRIPTNCEWLPDLRVLIKEEKMATVPTDKNSITLMADLEEKV